MKTFARRYLFILAVLALHSSAFGGDAATNQIDGFRDTPMLPGGQWHVHDPDRPQPRVVTPGASFSQNAPPPSDAETLFNGADLSQWQNDRGGDAAWKVHDGYMEVSKGGGIRTRGRWADFQLHV